MVVDYRIAVIINFIIVEKNDWNLENEVSIEVKNGIEAINYLNFLIVRIGVEKKHDFRDL